MRSGVDCNGIQWQEKELTLRMLNLQGKKFQRLTALFPVENINHRNGMYWLCECECGNQVVRLRSSLVGGQTGSCGCLYIEKKEIAINQSRNELIGQKFGKLTVDSIADVRIENDGGSRVYYKCYCDCGNKSPIIARGTSLKLGHTTSCGCSKKDREARDREDLSGKRFGKLVVNSFAYIQNNAAYWNCDCDCGRSVVVKGAYLNIGDVQSCGCLTSIGELNIMEILDNTDIKYLHNKGYFKDLVSEKGVPLRYDFILFDSNDSPIRLIEFDGPQHDDPNGFFGKDEFKRLKITDAIKNQYALSHNIPLVRIPYSKRDSMTLDDLLGDKYLYKGEI